MVRTPLVALMLAALAVSAGATAVPTFEESLGLIRRQILSLRADQIKARNQDLAKDIERLSRNAQGLAWDASRLRSTVSDLRRRAQRLQPNQPGRPNSDPFFRLDLDRAVWNARDLARNVDSALRKAKQISGQAAKDPDLVAPAQSLLRSAQSLESECRWLESEARWASWDIRRAGFSMEAWQLERQSADATGSSRDLEREARALLGKVQ